MAERFKCASPCFLSVAEPPTVRPDSGFDATHGPPALARAPLGRRAARGWR